MLGIGKDLCDGRRFHNRGPHTSPQLISNFGDHAQIVVITPPRCLCHRQLPQQPQESAPEWYIQRRRRLIPLIKSLGLQATAMAIITR
jgi:hypothetical protein